MINSRNNPRVKEWVGLSQKKERLKQNQFLVEGEHLVLEAKNKNRLLLMIKSETYTGSLDFEKTEIVSDSVTSKLSMTKSKSDIFGLVTITQEPLHGTRWLFLDSIGDPGNVGTLIRSAVSFGYDAVILNENCADPYSDKVVRSSQGAHFYINLIQCEFTELIKHTKNQGLQLVSTYLSETSEAMPSDYFCLCLGSEGSGLDPNYQEVMDLNVIVETSSFDSLNVGVAGSILMYLSQKNTQK